ncbi:MAG: GNAT family N-acetyltransferase [Candidatus Binataceae bacterium]
MSDSNADLTAMAAEPRRYSIDEPLRGGGSIHIRAILPGDKERLHEHFRGLSRDSVYFRFMGIRRDLTSGDLKRLTELDFKNHVALAATISGPGGEQFAGVGRYLRLADPRHAEIAFAVLDEHQGRGIGTLLLKHLGYIARAAGIAEFEAGVLGGNRKMLEVFENSGFEVRRSFGSGTVRVHLSMGGPNR